MKVIGGLLFAFSILFATSLNARGYDSDFTFNQERMIVDHGEIYLVSSFEFEDGITVYNFNGQRLWEVRFHSKILSWQVEPDLILVFSKDRNSFSTFITCLDRITGRILWQRP